MRGLDPFTGFSATAIQSITASTVHATSDNNRPDVVTLTLSNNLANGCINHFLTDPIVQWPGFALAPILRLSRCT